VHQLADDALVGSYHRLAVIGLLYELGTDSECNAFLDMFWDDFTMSAGAAEYNGSTYPDLNAKLSAELAQGYYHWYGSLTTPPCTEGVSWNLLKVHEKVCQRQIDRLQDALQGTIHLDFNNRVTQPLNHRVVTATSAGAVGGPENVYSPPEQADHWLYANDGQTSANETVQEATWGGLCVAGHEQSPINVVTAETNSAGSPSIQTAMDTSPTYLKTTGHGLQVFETSPALHVWDPLSETNTSVAEPAAAKGHSMIGGSKFNFYQVHWHTPSENTVDGKSYAMEAHFVHQFDDAALHGTYHRLAVIGLLYELGTDSECNVFLDKFWSMFSMTKGVSQYTDTSAFDLNAKLNAHIAEGYYHWYGSLTTPPCTEGVSWNLLKVTEKVCQRQVDTLKEALHNVQHLDFNNRVTQPLYHRTVTEMTPPPTPAPSHPHWVYANVGEASANGTAQEATWGAYGSLCTSGHEQSPINVVTNDAQIAAVPNIQTHIDASPAYLKNTGHGLQLFETSPALHAWDPASETDISVEENGDKGHSMIGSSKFNFYQVHWHTPSENTVNGNFFAMEAHYVHQLDDASLIGTYHRLAVIAVLYELDSECNTFLDEFWAEFAITKGVSEYTGTTLDLNEKLTAGLAEGYYHWYGSLTTPPCTEGVSWNLLKVTEKVCQRQVDTLREALQNTQHVNFNNRVTQPLHHRIVTEMTPDMTPPTPAPVVTTTVEEETEADFALRHASWSVLASTLVATMTIATIM